MIAVFMPKCDANRDSNPRFSVFNASGRIYQSWACLTYATKGLDCKEGHRAICK